MGKSTKIRWAGASWNPQSGCTKVSPGCDNCYAEGVAERFAGGPAYPNGFEPTVWEKRLALPARWRNSPRRIFVNSMSDVHHEAFADDIVDRVYDVMLEVPQHDYLILTKRPQRMVHHLCGAGVKSRHHEVVARPLEGSGWMARRGLTELPPNIWVGTSIESDTYSWRANWLRAIPAAVRFISAEPLLGPLPTLDLTGIHWVIAGGESGPKWRPMEPWWATDLRDRCGGARVAFFYKQGAALRSETDVTLDGRRHEEYPLPSPQARAAGMRAPVGRYEEG